MDQFNLLDLDNDVLNIIGAYVKQDNNIREFNELIKKDIFDYVNKALCHRTEDVNRYAMPRAALNLFTKHACNFDKYIYLNYKELFERIKK